MDKRCCNITENKTWIEAQRSRFDNDKIVKQYKHLFYIDEQMLISLVNFEFDIDAEFIQFIEKMICKYGAVKFEYLNVNDEAYQKLKMQFEMLSDKYIFTNQDIWAAPGLKVPTDSGLEEYIKGCDKNIRRNYARAMKGREESKLVIANSENVLECWNDALAIDHNSWKRDGKSDMKTLNREDLQYIFLLLKNIELCSLVVLYEESEPMAYSLMIRNEIGMKWYAVKWGCNKRGRENYSGVVCFFQHLEWLLKMQKRENVSNIVDIDFWGRRQRIYDSLANYYTDRAHVIIRRR